MKAMPKTPELGLAARRRAYAAGIVVAVALAGVAYKAWGLQVGGGARFRAQAARQYVRTVEVAAPRGAILDVRGRALAVTADADSVFANPREVVDVGGTAEALAAIFGTDVRVLEARLASSKHFVWIARHITPDQATQIRRAKLPGIDLASEPRRWYPGRTSGGPLLGFAGIDGDGLEGLELALDKVLRGERARFAALRDAPGTIIAADGIAEAAPGATVTLTLDRAIQHIADEALARAIETHQAKSGVVVVLDVTTGGVLAMASWPTYDPNAPGERDQARSRAITDAYEIGSVMKVFTIAAALEAGTTRPDEVFEVGKMKLGARTFRDTHTDAVLTTAGILKRSSNVGAIKIALRLGRVPLWEAFDRYGFGHRTGIELPGEQPGVLRDGRGWREIELATISFGYGLMVTPLQLAAGIAAIGNDGVYTPPRLVARIAAADGTLLYQHRPAGRRILRQDTVAALLPMLASVFEGGKQPGTAASLVVPGFTCGGKTGTAHKIDPATKTYDRSRYLSSFAGLAPIDRPRIAVVAVVDEPRGGDYYGGRVAGPVFAEVASETLRYLGVPGQPIAAAAPGQPAKAASSAKQPAIPPEEPPVVSLPPTDDPITLDDGAAGTLVPDFRGLGVSRVLTLASAAGLTVEVEGSGRAFHQEPGPGPAPIGTAVRVTFSPATPQTAGPPDNAHRRQLTPPAGAPPR